MDYLRSLKMPALEGAAGEGSTRRAEVESAHTMESEIREVPKTTMVGNHVSERDPKYQTQRRHQVGEKGNSSVRSNQGTVHQGIHRAPKPGGKTSQPCKTPERREEICLDGGSLNPGNQINPALECRNPSCDCKTVTC